MLYSEGKQTKSKKIGGRIQGPSFLITTLPLIYTNNFGEYVISVSSLVKLGGYMFLKLLS